MKWVGDAVGWSAVVYILAFAISTVVAGLETVQRSERILSPGETTSAMGALIAFWFLGRAILSPKVPPASLGSVDLVRLGLAPLNPAASLRWPFIRTWALRGSLAAFGGLVWWSLLYRSTGLSAPLAPLLLALLAVVGTNIRWLTYAGASAERGVLAAPFWTVLTAALALVDLFWPGWGLASALTTSATSSVGMALLLAVGSAAAVHRSLRSRYPPRFLEQCRILSDLRHLTLSSVLTGSMFDQDRHRSLARQLTGRRVRTTPSYHIPALPARWGTLGAVVWRTLVHLARRSLLFQIGLIAWVIVASAQTLKMPEDPVGMALTSLILGMVYAKLLGPPLRPTHLPITGRDRTLGRSLPGIVIAALVIGISLIPFVAFSDWALASLPSGSLAVDEGSRLLPFGYGAVLRAMSVVALGIAVLERLSTLSQQSQDRVQIFFFAGFLSILPQLLVGARLGDPILAVVHLALCLGLILWHG